MYKILLDTNIIIDFLGEREGFFETAAKIITLADKSKVKMYVTALSMATAYYIISKYESKKSALEKIRKLKVLCEISPMNDDLFEKALNSQFDDFEDALQYFSAVENGCNLILTRNEKDFKSAMIPVMNPESYIKSLQK